MLLQGAFTSGWTRYVTSWGQLYWKQNAYLVCERYPRWALIRPNGVTTLHRFAWLARLHGTREIERSRLAATLQEEKG